MLGNTQAVLTGVQRVAGGDDYSALVIVLDAALSWPNLNYMGFRSLRFFSGGSLVSIPEANIVSYGSTSILNASYVAKYGFISTQSLVDGAANVSALSAITQNGINCRYWVKLSSAINFDAVNYYGWHNNGTSFNYGLKDIVLKTSTEDVTPSDAYNVAFSGEVTIASEQVADHSGVNEEDPQPLTLI